MQAYEYEITSGNPFNSFWLLLPHPILVRKGQFILIDAAHRTALTATFARNVTLKGTVTVTSLRYGWYEVRDVQTSPFAPLAFEAAAEELADVADDRSMASSNKKRRRRVG